MLTITNQAGSTAATDATEPIASPAIVARGLTKRFGAVTAVEDLSFELGMIAVQGPEALSIATRSGFTLPAKREDDPSAERGP